MKIWDPFGSPRRLLFENENSTFSVLLAFKKTRFLVTKNDVPNMKKNVWNGWISKTVSDSQTLKVLNSSWLTEMIASCHTNFWPIFGMWNSKRAPLKFAIFAILNWGRTMTSSCSNRKEEEGLRKNKPHQWHQCTNPETPTIGQQLSIHQQNHSGDVFF